MSGEPLPSSFDGNTDFYEESRWEKFSRRLKEEPLIPIGCALTCWALFGASRSIRAGDHNRTNRMFRARIYAQGFTIVAMVAGSMYWQTDRSKRKEFDKVVEERKAKEKNEAWIKELEARDEEVKEEAARRRGLTGKRVREEVERVKGETKSVSEAVREELERKARDTKAAVESGADAVIQEADRKGLSHSIHEMMFGKKK